MNAYKIMHSLSGLITGIYVGQLIMKLIQLAPIDVVTVYLNGLGIWLIIFLFTGLLKTLNTKP